MTPFLSARPDYLNERLRYEPETGKLFWLAHPAMEKRWNSRWPGKEAFATLSRGRLSGRLDGRTFMAHRVIWAMVHGEWPDGEIDHIDHNPSNNRVENLRVVSREENARNMPLNSRNTSGVIGVHWRPCRQKWRARIVFKGRSRHIGLFDTIEEAAEARRAAEVRLGFHPNHGAQAPLTAGATDLTPVSHSAPNNVEFQRDHV